MIITEEKAKKYDALVEATLINIFSLSKEGKQIVLTNLNLKNKDHLFVLKVASLASDMFDLKVAVEGNFVQKLYLFLYNPFKMKIKVKENVKASGEKIDIIKLLDFEKSTCDFLGVTFQEVYEAYYERKRK